MYEEKKPGTGLAIAALVLFVVGVVCRLIMYICIRSMNGGYYPIQFLPGCLVLFALIGVVFAMLCGKKRALSLPTMIFGGGTIAFALISLVLGFANIARYGLGRGSNLVLARLYGRAFGQKFIYLPSAHVQNLLLLVSGILVLVYALKVRQAAEDDPYATSAGTSYTSASAAYSGATGSASATSGETTYGGLFTDSIGKLVVLSIVTFGIYGLIWQYRLVRNMRMVAHEDTNCAGEFLLLLFIPFYSIYWFYKRGKSFAQSVQSDGWFAEDRSVLYLILALFGFGIVNICLMQDDCNKLAAGQLQKYQQPAYSAAPGYGTPAYGAPQQPAASAANETVELIRNLGLLHEQGILTDEEFEQKKTELLAKL